MNRDPDEVLPYSPSDESDWPSSQTILLPTRAFLRSWREQTVPARRFAIDDAVEHFGALTGDDAGVVDMAVLGAIGEAMQPLEDLAYLGTAWDRPFQALPNYVRAITFGKFIANNFWQEVTAWDDERLLVFTGHRGRDPATGETVDVLATLERPTGWSDAQQAAIDAAREATLSRVRKELAALAKDWKQFSPYFLAYKHGGLAIARKDTAFVEDDVEEIDDHTPRHTPSIAVWTRSKKKLDIKADFSMSQDEVVKYAAGAGRAALRMVDAFVESRLALSEAIVYDEAGEMVGLRSLHIPWTHWLASGDLSEEHWEHVGRGPNLQWVSEDKIEGPCG